MFDVSSMPVGRVTVDRPNGMMTGPLPMSIRELGAVRCSKVDDRSQEQKLERTSISFTAAIAACDAGSAYWTPATQTEVDNGKAR